jgi:AcrR family transcriptional regulator
VRETGWTVSQNRILDASLELFAERGYAGTSMRMIASRSGMQASSIYSHFAGKEAILDATLAYYESEMKAARFWEGELEKTLDSIAPEQLLMRGFARIVEATSSPRMLHVLKFLLVENFRNEKVRTFYRKWFERQDREAIGQLFEVLMRRGDIRQMDVGLLTVMYRALLNHFYYEYFLKVSDGADTSRLREEIDGQIRLFLELLR